MKIYTKTGDQGQTGLWGGQRVSKNHQRLHAYGTLDELNSFLGLAAAHLEATKKKFGLTNAKHLALQFNILQSDLFLLGSELATPSSAKAPKIALIGEEETSELEKQIDSMEKALKPLKNFILPGGHVVGATLHIARAVCRRLEREVVTLSGREALRQDVIIYINRLGDYLFVLARFVNAQYKAQEVEWKARR